MILLGLRLGSFLGCGDDVWPPSPSQIHTIALLGENGGGRFGPPEAVTRLLWGRSRACAEDIVISNRRGSLDDRLFILREAGQIDALRTAGG